LKVNKKRRTNSQYTHKQNGQTSDQEKPLASGSKIDVARIALTSNPDDALSHQNTDGSLSAVVSLACLPQAPTSHKGKRAATEPNPNTADQRDGRFSHVNSQPLACSSPARNSPTTSLTNHQAQTLVPILDFLDIPCKLMPAFLE
jgi:hypothetical protein